MNLKEIRELIELINEKDIAEFELERSGTRLKISRVTRGAEMSTPAPVATPDSVPGPRSTLPSATSIPPPGASAAISSEETVTVRSPMVGTF